MFILFHNQLFIFFRTFGIRNWHRFSNPSADGLKVGCQRITEPVSHLFFINLRFTVCENDAANVLNLFSFYQTFFELFFFEPHFKPKIMSKLNFSKLLIPIALIAIIGYFSYAYFLKDIILNNSTQTIEMKDFGLSKAYNLKKHD